MHYGATRGRLVGSRVVVGGSLDLGERPYGVGR